MTQKKMWLALIEMYGPGAEGISPHEVGAEGKHNAPERGGSKADAARPLGASGGAKK